MFILKIHSDSLTEKYSTYTRVQIVKHVWLDLKRKSTGGDQGGQGLPIYQYIW